MASRVQRHHFRPSTNCDKLSNLSYPMERLGSHKAWKGPGATRHLQHSALSPMLLSLSRLNHWLPRAQAHPEVVQGTTEFHDQVADAFFPQPDAVFQDATPLDTTIDMLDPQST